MKNLGKYLSLLLLGIALPAAAQERAGADPGRLLNDVEVAVEVSGTASSGDSQYAPLWLTANRWGMSSVEPNSAYERVSAVRSLAADSLRQWKLGYGLDLALMQNGASDFIVQQAYVDAAWKALQLTVGAKERPLELKNSELSSGGMSLGINSRPIPQVRAELHYVNVPWTNGWAQIRGWLSYGKITDGSWTKNNHRDPNLYNSGVLYHEKAGYIKVGREDKFPLTMEFGLMMMAQFGGTTYNATGRGITTPTTLKHDSGLKAFWNALICRGSDEIDGVNPNAAGNHLGSWNLALHYKGKGWGASAYFERYFEDKSMLHVKYGIYDHLLGLEVRLPKNRFVSNVVVEHLSTTDQSGPVYHDGTATIPEHITGRDNYYDHSTYAGWQHWGMGIGHPFLTSPAYAETEAYSSNGRIYFWNNRVKGWHFALAGDPTAELHYRLLFSLTRNWGTYDYPFADMCRQNYFLAECTYTPRWAKGWQGTLGMGIDHGHLLGNSLGGQLRLRKSFSL